MLRFRDTRRCRAVVTVACLALAAGLPAGCDRDAAPPPLQGSTMGTGYTVKYARLPEGLTAAALHGLVAAELDAVNASMSTYDPGSEISRFNRFAGNDWFDISAELTSVVAAAQAIHARSDGAFDASVGPLVEAWGFGSSGARVTLPSAFEIEAARARVGMDRLSVRSDPPALRKSRGDLQLDLSAIAKGYAVDRVAMALQAAGVSDYLVEIGGELRTAGRRHDGNAWRIGIEQPVAGDRSVQRAITMVRDGAVATSGDYRNFFEMNGRRYTHLIDPRTGLPVDDRLASVTVIAADCTSADAWATALSVLGPRAGFDLAETQGLAALFIERDGDDFRERTTQAFDNWLQAAKTSERGELQP